MLARTRVLSDVNNLFAIFMCADRITNDQMELIIRVTKPLDNIASVPNPVVEAPRIDPHFVVAQSREDAVKLLIK